jgi:hypothetical protein
MAEPTLLVVLPTLGTRLDLLAEALDSCVDVAQTVPLTVAVIVPKDASKARQLAKNAGARIVDDRAPGWRLLLTPA